MSGLDPSRASSTGVFQKAPHNGERHSYLYTWSFGDLPSQRELLNYRSDVRTPRGAEWIPTLCQTEQWTALWEGKRTRPTTPLHLTTPEPRKGVSIIDGNFLLDFDNQ